MLLGIGLLIFLLNIDYTAVNLALVPIAEEIDGDLNVLQWLLSGYVLIWAALVVPAGRFADIHGKKFSLNLGIAIFILGSLVTGFGHHVFVLIAGRFIQGLGAAIFSPPAYGLFFSSVPADRQGMAMGFLGGAAGLGLAVGPTVAGWIIKEIGWRWLFYVNIPLGLLVILVLWVYAPPEGKQADAVKIDWPAVALLTFGLGSLVFALNQTEEWGIGDPAVVACGTGGFCLLSLFAYRDRQQPFQILPPVILQNKPFMSIIASYFILSYCFALVLVMMGLYLQNTLKLSNSETGMCFLAMTVAFGILSPVGGKLADRMDIRIPVTVGFALIFCGLLVLGCLTASSSMIMVCGGLLLAGLGLGVGFPSMNTGIFRTLAPSEINTGSAIFVMAATLGNAISVIASTSLLIAFARPKLIDLMAALKPPITVEEQQALISIISRVEHTPEQLKQFPSEQVPALLGVVEQAFLYGFSVTLWIGMALVVLAVGIFLAYFKKPLTS